MARILILLAIVLGILWWLRDRAGTRRAGPEAPPKTKARTARAGDGANDGPDGGMEPMVQCAQCGVHLPRGEAIGWQGLHYCRRSHLPDHTEPGGPRS
ncbi:hypothetical protein FOB72_00085 [Cupriavidus pauculus]|uniref:Uncharacterized protein n=1 Tax=Cupriavidus pauculus TaxID=82633 RepID=A0A5P2GYB6_9BURK|nr:PP0621 family protein [Cupriavidus pauculus]QET00581.1 hypothetical protein FOB72_00085 [Cupriavidus pauculus]